MKAQTLSDATRVMGDETMLQYFTGGEPRSQIFPVARGSLHLDSCWGKVVVRAQALSVATHRGGAIHNTDMYRVEGPEAECSIRGR